MPQTYSVIALTAICSTVGIASVDIRQGSKALDAVEVEPFLKPKAPTIPHMFQTEFASSAKSAIRGMTSLAFFHLAYQDYKRATCHDDTVAPDNDIGLAMWKSKAWAIGGLTTLALGPFGPYRGLLVRPLEQRLHSQIHLSEEMAKRLLTTLPLLVIDLLGGHRSAHRGVEEGHEQIIGVAGWEYVAKGQE